MISRRFFLGGAISLASVVTFEPAVSSVGNFPTIYGDGIRDDAPGLRALFNNEPVIFPTDKIAVDSHSGITFHYGEFRIDDTVVAPDGINLVIENETVFNGTRLQKDAPFFEFQVYPTEHGADKLVLMYRDGSSASIFVRANEASCERLASHTVDNAVAHRKGTNWEMTEIEKADMYRAEFKRMFKKGNTDFRTYISQISSGKPNWDCEAAYGSSDGPVNRHTGEPLV